MKKLYHLYNEKNEVTGAGFYIEGEQPSNSTLSVVNGQIKPMYNPEDDAIYEGASEEDIKAHRKSLVPETATAISFFVVLELMGISEDIIKAKIEELHNLGVLTLEEKVMALISIKKANYFERKHPFVGLIANAFNISEDNLDDIFIQCSKI